MVGITTRRIQQLTKEGVLKNIGRGKYDAAEAIQAYLAYQIELERKRYNDDDMKIAEAKRIQEVAEAKLKVIKLKKEEGKLVDREEFERMLENAIYNAKNKLLAIPVKVSARAAATKDPRKIKVMIEGAIYEALSELSGMAK
ncbi:MAG: hypothetical protein D6698_05300 [Gammaproteobacteria bacterium]|nr:MAG: hypothetical protein D6698_05300 [Gammaproteobacteria bacterium]